MDGKFWMGTCPCINYIIYTSPLFIHMSIINNDVVYGHATIHVASDTCVGVIPFSGCKRVINDVVRMHYSDSNLKYPMSSNLLNNLNDHYLNLTWEKDASSYRRENLEPLIVAVTGVSIPGCVKVHYHEWRKWEIRANVAFTPEANYSL